MKVLLVSYSDSNGAGDAALKLLSMLNSSNIQSKLLVLKKKTNLQEVIKYKMNSYQKLKNFINITLNRVLNFFLKKYSYFSTIDFLSLDIHKYINEQDFDVVQVIWPHRFLSIQDMSKINIKTYWRLSDYWLINGFSHYLINDKPSSINKLVSVIEYYFFKKRLILLNNVVGFISPSNTLKNKFTSIPLLNKFLIYQINTPIDKKVFFYIHDKITLYEKFSLKPSRKYVLFVSSGNNLDTRKGEEILELLLSKKLKENIFFITVGKNDIKINDPFKKIINFGRINNKKILNEIFNCASLTFIPSKIDNCPQTGIESLNIGMPILVSNDSGYENLIDKNYCHFFDINNIDEIIYSIYSILKKLNDNNIYRYNIIKFMEQNFSQTKILSQYLELYK